MTAAVPIHDSFATAHSVERALLGSLMVVGRNALPKVKHFVSARDFLSEAHRVIFSAIEAVSENGADPDLVLVSAELDAAGLLTCARGAAYLSGLLDALPDVENVVDYARALREFVVLRKGEKGRHRVDA